MDLQKIEAIKKSFSDDQKRIYEILLGDISKLDAEWKLCRRMYDDAVKVINEDNIGPEVRLLLRNVSDYWNRRRLVLERTMERVGMNDLLVKWRNPDAK
jgi:hypothetical protein